MGASLDLKPKTLGLTSNSPLPIDKLYQIINTKLKSYPQTPEIIYTRMLASYYNKPSTAKQQLISEYISNNPDLLKRTVYAKEFAECLGPLAIKSLKLIPSVKITHYQFPPSSTEKLIDYICLDKNVPVYIKNSAKTGQSTTNTIKFDSIYSEITKAGIERLNSQFKNSIEWKVVQVLADSKYTTFTGPEKIYELLKSNQTHKMMFKESYKYSIHDIKEKGKFLLAIGKELWTGSSFSDKENRRYLQTLATSITNYNKKQETKIDNDKISKAIRFVLEKIIEIHSKKGILNFIDIFNLVTNSITYIKVSPNKTNIGLFNFIVVDKNTIIKNRPIIRGKNGFDRKGGSSDKLGLQI